MTTNNQAVLGKMENIKFGSFEVPCFKFSDSMNPLIPENDFHIFKKKELMVIRSFMEIPDGDFLYLYGSMGTGKTTAIEHYCAQTNRPLLSFCCAESTELRDLLVRTSFEDGQIKYRLGVLAEAFKYGYTCLINEIDLLRPTELTALNEMVTGKPIIIPETGETIYMHKQFRFVATANTNGAGDESGLYQGTGRLNQAFIDRCRMVELEYLDPVDELAVLKKAAPNLPDGICKSMIEIANDIRDQFNPQRVDKESTDAPKLSCVLSTRSLIRWAKLTHEFKKLPDGEGIWFALEQSFLARAKSYERIAILEIAKARLGFN